MRVDPVLYAGTSTFEYRTFSSVQFSHSVMSDSLHPHRPQYARSDKTY